MESMLMAWGEDVLLAPALSHKPPQSPSGASISADHFLLTADDYDDYKYPWTDDNHFSDLLMTDEQHLLINDDDEDDDDLNGGKKFAEEILKESSFSAQDDDDDDAEGQWLNQANIDLSTMIGMDEPLERAVDDLINEDNGSGSSTPESTLYSGGGGGSVDGGPFASVYYQDMIERDRITEAQTEQLLKEFDSVYGSVGMVQQLTPPQTPPLSPQFFSNWTDNVKEVQQELPQQQLQQQQPEAIVWRQEEAIGGVAAAAGGFNLEETIVFSESSFNGVPASGDGDQDTIPVSVEYIDALLRDKVEEITGHYEDVIMMVNDDDCSQSNASFESASSASSDNEWMPTGAEEAAAAAAASPCVAPKRRPYARCSGDDKRIRKKEQNKNAATRYRQKKRQEIELILDEETRLRKINKKLTVQYNDARREVKYLKGLLREMYKSKGIVF